MPVLDCVTAALDEIGTMSADAQAAAAKLRTLINTYRTQVDTFEAQIEDERRSINRRKLLVQTATMEIFGAVRLFRRMIAQQASSPSSAGQASAPPTPPTPSPPTHAAPQPSVQIGPGGPGQANVVTVTSIGDSLDDDAIMIALPPLGLELSFAVIKTALKEIEERADAAAKRRVKEKIKVGELRALVVDGRKSLREFRWTMERCRILKATIERCLEVVKRRKPELFVARGEAAVAVSATDVDT